MKPVIISFEGLMGTVGRWLRRGLLNNVKGYVKFEHGWMSRFKGTEEACVIVGHSFGVMPAIRAAKNSPNCKLLLLLDPRMPPLGLGGVVAPENIRTVCIYQKGLMCGHPVLGAENILIKGVAHVKVPSTVVALEKLLEGLRTP